MLASQVSRITDTPLVYHVHSPSNRDSTNRWRNWLNAANERFSLRSAARQAGQWALVAQACERLALFVGGTLKADLFHGIAQSNSERAGLEDGDLPACVEACPTQAIQIEAVDVESWREKISGADAPGVPPSSARSSAVSSSE